MNELPVSLRPSSARICAYLAYYFLLATLTGILLGFFLFSSYRQTEKTIEISSVNEARVLAIQMEAALRRIQATADLVTTNLLREIVAERYAPEALKRANIHLESLRRFFPEVRGHRYYDVTGRLLFKSESGDLETSIEDQPFFQRLKKDPRRGLSFSETLPTSPRTLMAYQPVLEDSGAFLGLVVTPVDLEYFEHLFSRIDVGEMGMVSIRRSDTSQLVVRWPIVVTGLNKEAKDIPPQRQIEQGVSQGVIRYVGRTDGVDRIFAFHSIEPFPFYVLVGRATHEQFAQWRKMAVMTSALTVTGLVLLGLYLFRLRSSDLRLRQSEDQYQAIVESQHDAVCRWLPDTTLTFVNSRYRELFAARGEERLLGRQWIAWVAEEEKGTIEERISLLREHPLSSTWEQQVTMPDGSVRQIHWVDVPLGDSSGRCVEIQSVGRDITDLRQSEAEQKRLQQQLIQVQKMEAIGTLAGGIAHDFNNILGVIIGYTEMARSSCDPKSKIAANLNTVLRASHRAVALVKQILTFSRQDGGLQGSCMPADIAKEAMQLLRPSLPSTISIVTSIEDPVRGMQVDPIQFQQIVMNLCANAFHAMEETGGTLSISLRNRDIHPADLAEYGKVEPGPFVELMVSDTGAGIAPEIRNRIFEPFFTTKEVGKGTGMGLAIIHGIVLSRGGALICESEPGQGTTFRVLLPAAEITGEEKTERTETESPGKERVLFVDDEPLMVQWGKSLLEGLGYEVTMRIKSEEALDIFRDQAERFDVVITDQTMPGMTGMEMARQMLSIRPDIPIILCTGYSGLIDEEKALALGIKGFAYKPLTGTALSTLLRKVLDTE